MNRPVDVDSHAVFALPARVTVAEAAALSREARGRLRGAPGAWRVDASALRQFDSTCLSLLLELHRASGGAEVEVVGAPERLVHLAEAYGVRFLFNASEI